ncbi:hypothetical protein QNN86_20590 [Citrobacter sp. C348]|uniref:hypothetical protein n=1 Tax=unclassified Citrobacter TaxID=2644389 RepID=UPI0010795A07|nr:hypothetical protein [Citrobacter sp. Cb028]MDM3452139.1 hypothetical protein [Citrobacter sp. Cb028]HEM7419294.1 hypothetical protein [Citrobacter youngae]
MNKKISAYCCFIPICIYATYSLSEQLLYDVQFMAKSMVLSIIPSSIYLICFWKLLSGNKGSGLKITLLSNILLTLLLTSLVCFVGSDAESVLIAGIVVHSLIAFGYAGVVLRPTSRYKNNIILRDEETGRLYVSRGGMVQPLADNDTQYILTEDMKIVNFSGGETSFQNNGFSIPLNSSSNDAFDHGLVVNPASGMPMAGGISGLDIHGNSWGTNFNEPSNTYDPNRGY